MSQDKIHTFTPAQLAAHDSLVRQCAMTAAWRDLLARFSPAARRSMANLFAHRWTVSAIELHTAYCSPDAAPKRLVADVAPKAYWADEKLRKREPVTSEGPEWAYADEVLLMLEAVWADNPGMATAYAHVLANKMEQEGHPGAQQLRQHIEELTRRQAAEPECPSLSYSQTRSAGVLSLVERLAGKLAAVAHADGEDTEALALQEEAGRVLAAAKAAEENGGSTPEHAQFEEWAIRHWTRAAGFPNRAWLGWQAGRAPLLQLLAVQEQELQALRQQATAAPPAETAGNP